MSKDMNFFMKVANDVRLYKRAYKEVKAKRESERVMDKRAQFNHNFVQWLLSDPASGAEKTAADAPNNRAVKSFLLKNPNPTDAEVHKWAEENGWDRDHTERVFYRMAADHAKMGHV